MELEEIPKKEITRALHLAVYPNYGKSEDLLYTTKRYQQYVQHFSGQLFFKPDEKLFSTRGMGQLANQAQYRAKGIIKALKAAAKETEEKINVPQIKFQSCPARIEMSEDSSFDYWVGFETQFAKKIIRIPAKSHKRLRHFLRNGYTLNPTCELVLQKNGRWQVRVFVQKEVEYPEPSEDTLGIDVGIYHMVTRSDGYIGKSARLILQRQRDKNSERRRQNHLTKSTKTTLKQLLDIEARKAVHVAKQSGQSIVVEDPKILANLKSKLQWAKVYFAKRTLQIGEEEEVCVWSENPKNTSRTCETCGHVDKKSRVKSVFQCTACGNRTHADLNASGVIAQRGSASIRNYLNSRMQSGALLN